MERDWPHCGRQQGPGGEARAKTSTVRKKATIIIIRNKPSEDAHANSSDRRDCSPSCQRPSLLLSLSSSSSTKRLLALDLVGGATPDTTGAAGGDETDLLTGGSEAGAGGGATQVLVVTTTVRMVHRVHGDTTDLQ